MYWFYVWNCPPNPGDLDLDFLCHCEFIIPFMRISACNDKKPTLQKLHNSKLWYRPLNHKQEQNRRGCWQGRTCKTTTNNNVEKLVKNGQNQIDIYPPICQSICWICPTISRQFVGQSVWSFIMSGIMSGIWRRNDIRKMK